MARKSKAKIAQDKLHDMTAQLADYYCKELALIKPSGKATDMRYVVDAGVRLISFLQTCATVDSPITTAPGKAVDQSKLLDTFGALLRRQRADTRATPPHDAIEHVSPPTK